MKLYGFPGGTFSRHFRCQWMLEEVGADYEFIPLDFFKREHRSAEMRRLNPHARLPVMVDGDLVLWESSAICTYLGDKFPESGLVPRPGTADRALYGQWVAFTIAELEAQMMIAKKHPAPHYFPEMVPSVKVDENTAKISVALAQAEFRTFAATVEAHLSGREYLLDCGFSAADIILWWVLPWAADEAGLLRDMPSLSEYRHRLTKRPRFPVIPVPHPA